MAETSPLFPHIDFLRRHVADLELVLTRIKESTHAAIVAFSCDFLPFEILSASNIYPFVVPVNLWVAGAHSLPPSIDYIVTPHGCCGFPGLGDSDKTVITIPSIPRGYGEDSMREWDTFVGELIYRTSGAKNRPDAGRLSECTARYNDIRRLVRGICALRREKLNLLSNEDLFALFAAALCLPPEMLFEPLDMIRDLLNSAQGNGPHTGIPAMVYGGCSVDPGLLDELETVGLAIVEDDLCGGRRCFDLSHNASSTALYEEILGAFSFRPFCPCLRSAVERFDLLYRLVGSYGIETVVLIEDGRCPERTAHAEHLRIRLMRSGVDPLAVRPDNAVAVVKNYVNHASR